MDGTIQGDARAFVDEAIIGATRTEQWGEPDLSLIRAEAIAPPAFPDNVLSPFWARWAAEAAEEASAPQAFIATALLSSAGIAIGNARWASPWQGWKEPPAVNVALIGRQGNRIWD